jgi:hypothetical protein
MKCQKNGVKGNYKGITVIKKQIINIKGLPQ